MTQHSITMGFRRGDTAQYERRSLSASTLVSTYIDVAKLRAAAVVVAGETLESTRQTLSNCSRTFPRARLVVAVDRE